MKKPIPRLLAALVVTVLLLCSVTVAWTILRNAAIREDITQVTANLDAVRQRLKKQQVEYAQVQADLPVTLAELEALQPQADDAYARAQALRQQRKELRAANAEQQEQIAALSAQADSASGEEERTAQAIAHLNEALAALEALSALE